MSEKKRTDAIAGDIIHEYDGIEEADNELPNWWLAIFYGSVLFAAGYWLMVDQHKFVPSPAEALAIHDAEKREKTGTVSDDDLVAASKQDAVVAEGQQVFATTCAVCHGDKGEGKIGPNLTDAHWIHGGAPTSIFNAVRDGVAAKGMPAWGAVLGQAKVKSAVAYVLTVRNTNVPGKEPQGDVWKP
jgi:cytochrome c oxidase cbb3-type subunit III